MKKIKTLYDSPDTHWQKINIEAALLTGSRPGDASIDGFADDEEEYTW